MRKCLKKILCSLLILTTFMGMSLGATNITSNAYGNYKTWKQYDSRWTDKKVGDNGTMGAWGCKITSLAILMVHAGVENESNFNPGTLVDRYENAGFISHHSDINLDGNLSSSATTQSNSPNFYQVGRKDFTYSSFTSIHKQIRDLLNDGYYVEVRVNNNGHSIAVDYCSSSEVYIMDPGYSKTKLSQWNGSISCAYYYKAKGSSQSNINVTYQVHENVGKKWLANVTDKQDYAGIFGRAIDCVYANLSSGNITYKVHVKGGSWLSAVKNRNDYAGVKGKPIDGLMMKTDTGKTVHYRVHLKNSNRWLSWVTGYSTYDSNNGYAGMYGQEIDAIQVYVD
ncbi:hypothetical protein [Vallitalea guaymasensis]|uniref:hypothetical protein n=1 Tax=Vallitalea guaymasensis TaxID=1185412 RepID=UPI002357CB55|nr:hypothetical protein [Vallitalea guaymasensis]